MRIQVTGASGFLGGRIARELSEAGHQVVAATRSIDAISNAFPEFFWKQISWQQPDQLDALCENIDIVIHTAGLNAVDSASNPEHAHAFNGEMTANLARSAAAAGVKRFIYLSTAHVYNSPLVGSYDETSLTLNDHPYATSHRLGELGVKTVSEDSSMQGVVLRLTNVYGAPIHKSANCWMLLVNDLCRQAIETKSLKLHSNGVQLRDFVTLSRVISTILQLCTVQELPEKFSIFNLGSGRAMSVYEMASLVSLRVRQALDITPSIEFQEGSKIDTDQVGVLDISIDRIKQLINVISENPEKEIDELLNFCMQSFEEKAGQS
jgi:UDP-glucose 4-epimerase